MYKGPVRKKNRLENYDYSSNNCYFVTICTKNMICCLGNVVDDEMLLNTFGKIVQNQLLWLEKQYPYILVDEWVIMPNHVHAIITIDNSLVGNGRDRSLQVKIKSLPEIVGAFKTTSSKMIHEIGFYGFEWQKSFYDHIIRNEKSLEQIRNYILENPEKWDEGRNLPAGR